MSFYCIKTTNTTQVKKPGLYPIIRDFTLLHCNMKISNKINGGDIGKNMRFFDLLANMRNNSIVDILYILGRCA